MSAGFRTVAVTPEGLVHLLQALGTDKDVRLCGHGVPEGVGLAGARLTDDGVLEINLAYHRWPDEFPPDEPIRLMYARRLGRAGNASDWGAPQPLDTARVQS